MSEPSRPYRLEFAVEVPGPPEAVWDAIATARGLSAWMMPTELDERAGGAVVFHMGPEMSSRGKVTGWDPPRRLVYEEDWASLAGQDASTVTPLVSEFLVEARSGGTCVVRVVTSAFGSGADWEREFFDDMVRGWVPMFEHLRLYLAHFAGEQATMVEAATKASGSPTTAVAGVRRQAGIETAGQRVELLGTVGTVERVAEDSVLVRLDDPVPGMLSLHAWADGPDTSTVRLAGYLFSERAQEYAKREGPAWQTWLEQLATAPTDG